MRSEDPPVEATVHASCVAIGGRGVLIQGGSGSGKSTLALQLMAFGATLVSDDRVHLRSNGQAVLAWAPDPLSGLIEARGIGLLQADVAHEVPIACVVNLDVFEVARMPKFHTTELLGQNLVLLNRVEGPHFAPAVFQFLRSGRKAT